MFDSPDRSECATMGYLRWSLQQIYLLLFNPSLFEHEVEHLGAKGRELSLAERFDYLFKMIPWTGVGALLIDCLVFQIWRRESPAGVEWGQALLGVAAGEAIGMAFGCGFGVAFGMPSMLLLGAGFGQALGMAGTLNLAVLFALWLGPFVGVLGGVCAGHSLGLSRALALAATVGLSTALLLLAGLLVEWTPSLLIGLLVGCMTAISFHFILSALAPRAEILLTAFLGVIFGSLLSLVVCVILRQVIPARETGSNVTAAHIDRFLITSFLFKDLPISAGLLASTLVAVAVGLIQGYVRAIAIGLAVSSFLGLTLAIDLPTPTEVVDSTKGPGGLVAGILGVVGGITCGVAIGKPRSVIFGLVLGVVGGLIIGCLFGLATFFRFDWRIALSKGVAAGVAFACTCPIVYFRLVTYPLDVLLAAASASIARLPRQTVSQAWLWCPVAWNEVIWLPLPFVRQLLVLQVRHDRNKGFREVAFVAAERKLQRRAARAALVEAALADLRAQSIKELAQVGDKLNWTTDAPLELPTEFAVHLPRFHRATQFVAQYLTLQSPYRRKDALDQAQEEVQGLQQSLVVGRGTMAPRLLQAANEWHLLLRGEGSRLGVRAQDPGEIPSPFVFGNPVTEREAEVFSGRRNIVRQIEASVFSALQPPTILLHGPRRMGKTSILYQLPRLLGPEFSPALVDCQNPAVTSNASMLLFYFSRSIGQGLQRRHVTVPSLSKEQMEVESFAKFDQWLDELEHAMPVNMRILLCLDEYERLHRTLEEGWGEECLDALRHTLQHRSRIVVMFTGVHTFEQLGPAWTDRFISARRIRVSFLAQEEILPLLTKPIPEFNMRYVPEALECIYAATNGQPFLTQAVAFELVQYLNEEQRKQATLADVENSIERALVTASEYFANVWYDAGAEGQAILQALARGIKPPEDRQARAWLVAQDVLTDDDRFAVPMMERWVRKEKQD